MDFFWISPKSDSESNLDSTWKHKAAVPSCTEERVEKTGRSGGVDGLRVNTYYFLTNVTPERRHHHTLPQTKLTASACNATHVCTVWVFIWYHVAGGYNTLCTSDRGKGVHRETIAIHRRRPGGFGFQSAQSGNVARRTMAVQNTGGNQGNGIGHAAAVHTRNSHTRVCTHTAFKQTTLSSTTDYN